MKRLFWIGLFCALGIPLAGQDKPIFPLFIAPDLDTNYIDLQRDKWSIRAFSSLKYHALRITDKSLGQENRYIPNNLFAVGVGFAYRFWLIDIGFGLNPVKEDPTESFDLQTSVILGSRHLFSFGFQLYQGFEQRESGPNPFREDLRILYSGLDYSYYFNYRKLSMRAVFRGDLRQLKSAFSPILGAFINGDYVRADSSFFGARNPSEGPSDIRSYIWMTGVQAGIAGAWVPVRHVILFGTVMPGLGGEWGRIEGGEEVLYPRWGPVGKLNLQAAIMYTHPRFYCGLTGNGNFFFPVVNDRIQYRYQVGKLKLLFGWRFFSRVGFLEKANRLLEKR